MRRLFVFALTMLLCNSHYAQELADIAIVNAKILDGTGNPWFRGDIIIHNGKIREILPVGKGSATRIIDAKGLIVTPGFIDVHTHFDGNEFKNPGAGNYIYDGVTTILVGNCGSSRVNIKNYLTQLDSLQLAINVGTLMGHSTLRRNVVGTHANRAPTEAEMVKMEQMLERAMRDGAFGLSTGLIYIPGTYAKTDEVVRLAKVSASFDGVYATHMRDEADSVLAAIREAIQIGRESGARVQLSHLKASGHNNWGKAEKILELISDARAEGIEVVVDSHPYIAGSTHLSTLLPPESLTDGKDSILARLRNPKSRAALKKYLLADLNKKKLKNFDYAVVASFDPEPAMIGKSIVEINKQRGRKSNAENEAETILELMETGVVNNNNFGGEMIYYTISEDDLQTILKYPHNICISDAGIRLHGGKELLHPRAYGSNARVLGRYVRELKIITLEDAVRRMTSLPAQQFQIENKGQLRPGFDADVLVFDPDKITDKATFESPYQYSEGIQYVLVNGKVVLDNGEHTGTRPGKTIRKK
ncbi:MAG: D-aminoacylase [Chitinophagaceae bacterium]|nr:D-aminoacylase [Chitinophagaceae bacterium]